MAVIDRLRPYAEQLLENQDVQADLQQAAARARQAYGGARSKKTKRKALSDDRVRQRVTQSVAAARDAVADVRAGRAKQERRQRRRRRGRLLLLLVPIAGGAFLALDEGVRNRMLGLLGADADAGSSGQHDASVEPDKPTA